ncbi:cytochrome P450 [Falsiroseomonas sp. HW251]|uniref:cytochrome P450 n=1 Tax=Falsiroseomonas sp. HW251 TaxID=3390998 RepID=UPI003D3130E6
MIRAASIHLPMWGAGLAAAFRLAGTAIRDRAALAPLLGTAAGQREVFAVLRAFWPNLRVGRKLVTAYDNTGTAVVTRRSEVTEVLDREADFAVVYEPKMRAITAGENFFLGMQDGVDYQRDTSSMRLAARRDDVARIVQPFAAEEAAAIVAVARGTLDVPAALTRRVPARLVARYFGLPYDSEETLIDQATRMFWYLFVDLKGEESVSAPALAAAAAARDWIDACIAARKANPSAQDDVLGRCLALQAAGVPGMDDRGIRNNLIGLVIGLVPTLSKAATQALSQLLDRPDALAMAQVAARAGDDARLAEIVFEALRFDPVNPVIYRRAVRDTEIARGTWRSLRIPKGTMVLAANLSAMFDSLAMEKPEAFRPGRPWGDYMLWGYGMHACFGGWINRAVVPAMLKPVLAKQGLRRAEGEAGRIDGRTPFPANMTVLFDD